LTVRINGEGATERSGGTVELLLASAWLAAVVLLIIRAAGQQKFVPRLRQTPRLREPAPAVAIVVPARDEAANIALCLTSVLAQSYPRNRLRLIMVDDQSIDATAAIAGSIARADPRLEVATSPPLPQGWMGKPHACQIGYSLVGADVEWLCFIDADTRASPALLASAIHAVLCEQIDLLSLTPFHELKSFAERLMLPCGLYLLAFAKDLARSQDPRSDVTTATGQFMLIRRRIYDAVGGHAAVRNEICEDLALARLIKQAGGRVLLKRADQLLTARMYTGWQTLWPGFAKNLVDMFGGPWSTATAALLAFVLSWTAVLLPIAITIADRDRSAATAIAMSTAASLIALLFHTVGAAHLRIPIWYGLLFPLAYTLGALLALDSILRRGRGRITWKGRTYP
jgi:chlorobactene glucosyltransferase